MRNLHDRLKKAFPFLGTRAATEDDLFAYCTQRRVDVVHAHEIHRGVYVRHELGTDHIFLNKQLIGQSLVYVLAHEIAHHLLHVPRMARGVTMTFDGKRCNAQRHNEAETAAALLMFTANEARHGLTYENLNNRDLAALLIRRWIYEREYGK